MAELVSVEVQNDSPSRGKATKFKQLKVFDSEQLYKEWSNQNLPSWKNKPYSFLIIASCKVVFRRRTRIYAKSVTEEYECSYARLVNFGCLMKLRVRRPYMEDETECIIVEESEGQHDHKAKRPMALNERVKKLIREDTTSTSMQIQDKIQVFLCNTFFPPHVCCRLAKEV